MYKVNIPSAGEWVFSTCNETTNFNTKIYVGITPCNQDLGENSDFCTNNKAEITLNFTSAQDVYVIIASENNELGTFELKVSEVVNSSITNPEFKNKMISVYPNPTTSVLNIDLVEKMNAEYQIINSLGAIVKKGTLNNKHQIEVNELSNGYYNVFVIQNQNTYRASFIIEK